MVEGPTATTRQRRRAALGVLLVLSFALVAWLAAPVWLGIVFGALLAFSVQPFYRQMCRALGQRRRTAAFVSTFMTGVACILGFAAALYVSTRELVTALTALQGEFDAASWDGMLYHPALRWAEKMGLDQAAFMRRVTDELARGATYVTQAAGLLLQTTTTAVVSLAVGCVTMYYVLLEWPRLPIRLEKVLPLDPRHTRALMFELCEVGRSALIGTVVTAFAQGALGALGYAIARVPHAISWGLLTAVASFVPAMGTAIVWGPIGLYYLARGEVTIAVAIAAWGMFLIVGIGDYFVRPWFIGRQGQGQPLLMLVSALGGISVLGLSGIVVGPVLMSLFLAILHIYEREMESPETLPAPSPIASAREESPEG